MLGAGLRQSGTDALPESRAYFCAFEDPGRGDPEFTDRLPGSSKKCRVKQTWWSCFAAAATACTRCVRLGFSKSAEWPVAAVWRNSGDASAMQVTP